MGQPSVLHVVQPVDGGAVEHVLRQATGMRARGISAEVAASPANRAIGEMEAAGVPVHRLEMGREPGPADAAAARGLRRLDRAGGYDIVHAHSSKAGALVRAALPGRRRLVYTPHCFAFAAGFSRSRRLAYRLIEQALVPRSAAIVAVCEWERELGRSALVGADRVLHTIVNGVESSAGAAPAPELVEFAAGQPLAGMVSGMREQKDPLLAVRAMARLETAGSDGRLAIVGNGELEAAVAAEIAARGLGERVRWFPFAGDVGSYLAALDVFVLPSAWEAFPLAILEAMTCSLPVVATAVGGVPEAVVDGETGRLVPPGDEQALASALGALLENAELRARQGAAALERVERCFRVDRMVDETLALYERLGSG